MRRRFLLSGTVAALALAASCTDQIPTLVDEPFPPGSVPVTREVILPASEFFRLLGSHDGYGRPQAAPYVVVANDFEGLDAHVAARFSIFPRTVTYRRDGVERTDTLFAIASGKLVMRVDTAASTQGTVTLQVWEAAQDWNPGTATWETAVDTGSVRTPWTQPGGTRGDLLAQATFTIGGSAPDSLLLVLAGPVAERLTDTTSRGIIITAAETGRRIELADILLRTEVRPDSALPDTLITVPVGTSGLRTTLFTPDQPQAPAGAFAVGGIRRARALIDVNPRQQVPACPPPEACGTVPLSQVQINRVSLLLRPVDVPSGFDPLGPTPLTVRTVTEPELGRFAPLGGTVGDAPINFSVRDTLVEVPLTGLASALVAVDTFPTTVALVSESPVTTAAPSFGVGFFAADPRLRIIYTLPSRRQLP